MSAITRTRRLMIVAALSLVAFVAAACEIVGEGDLHVQNDLSGIGADNTVLVAMAADPGDAFPPPGMLSLAVSGDDFGSPPDYGMDGYLYLVRTDLECPMSEGAPEVLELDDVAIVGIVTVRGGSVNQFFTMDDDPANRSPRWAMIAIFPFSDTEPGHLVHRCGTVTWS